MGEEDDGFSIGYGIFMIILGAVIFPLSKLLTKVVQKKIDKSMNLMGSDTKEVYTFTEDKIYIETEKLDMYKSSVEAGYGYVYKILETENAYFLYISKMQCHVVQKKYITEGSFAELNGYFTKNFSSVTANRNGITYNK